MQQEKKYPIGGYAPGNYHCHCGTCGGGFRGHKRAYQCEPCALNDKAKFDALPPTEQEALVKKNAQAMNEMFSKVGTFTTESPSKEGNKERVVTPLTEQEMQFMQDCNFHTLTDGGAKILTENDEGARMDRADLIRLSDILFRYANQQNRNNG